MSTVVDNVAIKDAQIVFRNFSGREDKYNRAGARNFCLVLTPEEAEELRSQGWNVKTRPPRDEHDDDFHYLKINVQFATRGRPPRVVMVTAKNKTRLDEDTVDLLDSAEIKFVDVRFRPYEYEDGKYSAYLVTMFANIVEDELEERYSDIPEQGMSTSREGFNDDEPF